MPPWASPFSNARERVQFFTRTGVRPAANRARAADIEGGFNYGAYATVEGRLQLVIWQKTAKKCAWCALLTRTAEASFQILRQAKVTGSADIGYMRESLCQWGERRANSIARLRRSIPCRSWKARSPILCCSR